MNKFNYYNFTLSFYFELFRKNQTYANKGFLNCYGRRLFSIIRLTIFVLFGILNKRIKNTSNLKGEIWLFVLSDNNELALAFLKSTFHVSKFVTLLCSKRVCVSSEFEGEDIYDLNKLLVIDMLWAFPTYLCAFFVMRKHRIFLLKYPHLFFLSYLSLRCLRRVNENTWPKLIVFSNDLNIQSRALNYFARAKGIKTVYIQHAAVSESFPKLFFDLSLLDGQYSADVYGVKSNDNVKFIGLPKLDKYVNYRRVIRKVEVIGVAFNIFDNLSDVEALVAKCESIANKVIVRMHPRDDRVFHLSHYHSVCKSTSITSFDYLRKIDLLVSSDSSILLEGTLMNVPSIYYNMNGFKLKDYYGFVKNNVVMHLEELKLLDDLISFIERSNNDQIYQKASYYCSNYSGEYSSSVLAVDAIKSLISK